MSSGERPIGAAKGKQPNTEALCQPPPLPPPSLAPYFRSFQCKELGGGGWMQWHVHYLGRNMMGLEVVRLCGPHFCEGEGGS